MKSILHRFIQHNVFSAASADSEVKDTDPLIYKLVTED